METAAFDTADGLYDCAWSEENENIVLAASGDGSVKVYDLAAPPMANPLRVFREHKHEVSLLVHSSIHRSSQKQFMVLRISCQTSRLAWPRRCICIQCCCIPPLLGMLHHLHSNRNGNRFRGAVNWAAWAQVVAEGCAL